MHRIRVLIADDHALLREGVGALLKPADDLKVVGEAEDGRQAVEECRRLAPDVVLMDIAMPGLGVLEAALQIRREDPRVKVLVLTQFEEREHVARLLRAGASGYVLKRAPAAELVSAIRAVHRGGIVLDPAVAPGVVREGVRSLLEAAKGDPYESLTDREKQVLKLVAEGRERVMGKLGLHTRTELVKFALRRGVIQV